MKVLVCVVPPFESEHGFRGVEVGKRSTQEYEVVVSEPESNVLYQNLNLLHESGKVGVTSEIPLEGYDGLFRIQVAEPHRYEPTCKMVVMIVEHTIAYARAEPS